MISEFVKEKVFWTRKMNLKLVKFMENRPHIWNQRHPKYTSSAMKDQTFAEFAAEYGNEFTGRAVKDRWTNIRTTYAHHLRKMKANTENGKNGEYKVNWHLWDACQFLRNASKPKDESIEGSTATKNVADVSSFLDNVELNDRFHFKVDNLISDPTESNNLCNGDSLLDHLSCSSVAENMLTVFKGIQNDSFGLNNTKHGKIGRAVAKKLDNMNSYDAAQLSQEIMGVLLLYDENNPNNPNNNIKSESAI